MRRLWCWLLILGLWVAAAWPALAEGVDIVKGG
jgi:hypothetical protein